MNNCFCLVAVALWVCFFTAHTAVCASGSASSSATTAHYDFVVQPCTLTMTDGVRVAVTLYLPVSTNGERFPAILEMVPYRKDDFFCLGDYEYGSYFARHGYTIVRADVRGTGSSEGTLPDREYSDAELADAVEIIAQLSSLPWCNGNVGMYGISWSGFNALMVAHRRPPALKAIIAAHASDDLFYNDVHYIDGALHIDSYAQQIDADNGLPRSPDYTVDTAYFSNRFDREPWLFTWLREQRDGAFWRRESLRFKSPNEVPAYVIGGLLDGYRDFVTHVIEHSTAPVLAEIGPWNHAYPEYGKPGPNYEWRQRAIRWWDYWLKGVTNGILDELRFMVFVREGHPPSTSLDDVPGSWRFDAKWPIVGTAWRRLHPDPNHALDAAMPTGGMHRLAYRAGAGMAAGGWWGEQTGDMADDDATSLVYDSGPLTGQIEIVGLPTVSLEVAADAPLYHWSVRLEDVHPDGAVSLVSGALINPTQRASREQPEPLTPGVPVVLTTSIHFTTWTFKPGHRIRLAVANAQFPMAWPTPATGETTLVFGPHTWLELPVPPPPSLTPMVLPEPEPSEESPEGEELVQTGPFFNADRDDTTHASTFSTSSSDIWRIGSNHFSATECYTWSVKDDAPAEASYKGHREEFFEVPGQALHLLSRATIQSSTTNFTLTFIRTLLQNGSPVREKTWTECIPRDCQ